MAFAFISICIANLSQGEWRLASIPPYWGLRMKSSPCPSSGDSLPSTALVQPLELSQLPALLWLRVPGTTTGLWCHRRLCSCCLPMPCPIITDRLLLGATSKFWWIVQAHCGTRRHLALISASWWSCCLSLLGPFLQKQSDLLTRLIDQELHAHRRIMYTYTHIRVWRSTDSC